MEETFCKKMRKYCRLTNRYTDIREPIVRIQPSDNSEGEITVHLPESCSYAGKCYTEFFTSKIINSKNQSILTIA